MAGHDEVSRPRSPDRERDRKRQRRHSPDSHRADIVKALPFGARTLNKHDLEAHRPMFTLYLDIQKHKDIDELDEREIKGRWKSFIHKWNRGELAEGWYDPQTLTKAVTSAASTQRRSPSSVQPYNSHRPGNDEEDEDDDYGPDLPADLVASKKSANGQLGQLTTGPSIPRPSDLVALREEAAESAAASRQASRDAFRSDRKTERKLQTQRLDELVPRAESGTRERQLEKRKEAAASNRSFAQAAHEAGDADLPDDDVMGDADSLGQLKKMKRENERKKNERELRREEMARARRAEREEKLDVLRKKEAKTMEGLRALAQARFGGGAGGVGDEDGGKQAP
ncbi:uncharacterized protein AB675_7934 [Cyphellophora attinorum]|uniref:Uncharacterized protein n=1 Tax=Cyphellophora attinorum TaxID=1664694 RepID=A0A0N1HB74_9EURO|nr:uncharacterized protein AB675_7934 [Phialophora attinorum]KPI41253.1 hypothetical protein AB675_7934 [Phialophora attinorum]